MGLENEIKINDEESLRSEIESKIKELQGDEARLANESIASLNENQLVTFIKATFYDKDNNVWENYEAMRSNMFYGFMVQAAIDLLNERFNNKKYDKDGNEGDGDGYKSLDDWLKSGGGIDNKVGGKTRTAVRIAQKLLDIEVDGVAGPQFFAAVCAELKGESVPSDFKVRNRPKYTERYNFNGTEQTITIPQISNESEEETISFNIPNGYSLGNIDSNNHIPILKSGSATGAFLFKNSNNGYEIGYIEGYDISKGEFSLNDNKIIFTKSDNPNLNNIPERLDEKDFNKLKEIFVRGSDNGSLRFVVRDESGNIKRSSKGNIIVYSVVDNNDSYYVWDQQYIGNGTLLNGGTTSYDTGLYKLVKKNIDCGGFSSLFSRGYEDLQDDKIQEILKKDPKDRSVSDLKYLGSKFSSWTHPVHQQQLGAWLCRSSDNLSGGQNFIDWCSKMEHLGVSTKKLTLRNWFALSAMGCDNPKDFIEESSFQKKYNSKES